MLNGKINVVLGARFSEAIVFKNRSWTTRGYNKPTGYNSHGCSVEVLMQEIQINIFLK